MPQPKQRLRNLKVREVSLVDDGDNPGADVLVWKRRTAKQPTVADVSPAGMSDEERRRRRFRSGRHLVAKATATTSADGEGPHTHTLEFPNGPLSSGRFITEEAEGHTHEVIVPDLEPGQSADLQTSANDGHTHSIRVTAVESEINTPADARRVQRRRTMEDGSMLKRGWLATLADTIRDWSGKEPDEDLEKRLFDDIRAERMTEKVAEALTSRVDDLSQSVREIMFGPESAEDNFDPQSAVEETLKQFVSTMDDELAGIFAGQIAKRLDRGDDEGAPSDDEIGEILKDLFTLPTGEAPGATRKEGDSGMDLTKLSKKDREEVEAALTKAGTVEDLTTQLATANAEVVKLKKGEGGEGDPDPLESLPEDVRKVVDPLLKSAQDEASKATTENADLRKRLDKIESDNAREAFAKGIGDLGGLPQKREDIVELLWTMQDEEARATMQKNLEAAAAAARRGNLFGEIGSGLGGDGDGSAYAKIEAAATEIRKAKPDMTEAQARAQAMNENPELYDAYLEENPSPVH